MTVLADVTTSAERGASYLSQGDWNDVTLVGQVTRWASERPTSAAVIDAEGTRTYAQLAADAAGAATFLRERGVGSGAIVSIQLPNQYEAVVAAVAVLGVGAVINPLLPNYRERELAHVFRAAKPSAIFTPAHYRRCDHPRLVGSVAQSTGVEPINIAVGGGERSGAVAFGEVLGAGPSDLTELRADAVSELIFTSGTEAAPKAIMHTEQTAGFSVRVARDDLGVTGDDVVWMPSPVGHSTGFNYGVRFALHHGLPLVLQDRWSGADAVELILRERCTYTLAATTFLQDLVEAASAVDAELPTMRLFGCGGAPVRPALTDAAAERSIGVLRLYGSTEVLVATWNRPDSPVDRRRLTDGRPMSRVEVGLRRDDGSIAEPGEAGEIVVRGPNTCVGYFDDPERLAATFDSEGWVRSGDLATLDSEGYLTVVGRRKEILIRGGINIAPREIEELIAEFSEVQRAAVVGLHDERLGERMCACVVLHEGASLTLETMVERLRAAGLATYKLPQVLRYVAVFPTTASGKVQKHELVQTLLEKERR